MRPLLATSRPASKPSSVDLPEPDAPVIAALSPVLIVSEIPFRIGSSPALVTTTLVRLSAQIMDFIDVSITVSNFSEKKIGARQCRDDVDLLSAGNAAARIRRWRHSRARRQHQRRLRRAAGPRLGDTTTKATTAIWI